MRASRRCWTNYLECFAVLAGVCVVACGGCSKPNSEVVICREEGPTPVDAAEVVRNTLAGLQHHELQALWAFLPPSFRSDVEKLTHEIGERLDETSWRPFVATCQKAREVVSLLIKQFEGKDQAMDEPDRELIARLRDLEQLLFAIQKSDLSDVARIRQLDGRRFLSQISHAFQSAAAHEALKGAGLGNDSFSTLREVTVELTESAGDTAVLTVQWPGQEPTQHKFVRVEAHWIPQTLAEAWSTEFPKVREQCLAWADELRVNPEPWHARLREIDQLLDELAATKSLAEARQVWQAGASRLVVEWFGISRPEPPQTEVISVESSPPTKPARVKKPDTEVLLPDEPEKEF